MRKNHVFLMLILLGMVLITHFQNCGRTQNQASTVEQTGEASNGKPWGSLDPVYQGDLKFSSNYYQLTSTPNQTYEGLCDQTQEGAFISWRLEKEDLLKARGHAMCLQGAFSIVLQNTLIESLQLACGEELALKAQLGAHAHDIAFISKSCSARN